MIIFTRYTLIQVQRLVLLYAFVHSYKCKGWCYFMHLYIVTRQNTDSQSSMHGNQSREREREQEMEREREREREKEKLMLHSVKISLHIS